jgi:hypothetical protein
LRSDLVAGTGGGREWQAVAASSFKRRAEESGSNAR